MSDARSTFQDLDFSEQFVVWAARGAAHNRSCACGNPVDLAIGFRLARAEAALPPLLAFMQILESAAERPISLHAVACGCLSSDEHILLECVASLQNGGIATAHRLLHRYLPCSAARPAVWVLEAFARHIRDAGMLLRNTTFDELWQSALDERAHETIGARLH